MQVLHYKVNSFYFRGTRPEEDTSFIEIALRHGWSPVNLLHIFRSPFPKNTSGWLLLDYSFFKIIKTSIFHTHRHLSSINSLSKLMILTGKNHVFLNLVQESIEIEAWLLMTFLICLHNQLSSVHFIVTK